MNWLIGLFRGMIVETSDRSGRRIRQIVCRIQGIVVHFSFEVLVCIRYFNVLINPRTD